MPETKPSPLAADPFYGDGAFYDALYATHNPDLGFYLEEALWSNGPALELACGTGRLTIPLAAAGVSIVGMDLSPTMLDQARAKAPELQWTQGDMRQFSLNQRFALIYVAFNSLQHLHADEEIGRLCRCLREHLLPAGRFILDVFNPKPKMLMPPAQRRPVGILKDPSGRGTLRVEETRSYNHTTRIVHSTWYCSLNAHRDFSVTELHLRCFYPDELPSLLASHGLIVEKLYGDFSRKPFTAEDEKQILVCRLTAD